MKNKRIILLNLIILSIILGMIPVVYADVGDTMNTFGNVMDLFYGFASSLGGSTVLKDPKAKEGFLRFLFMFAVGITVYAGLSKIPAFNNRTAGTLAVIIAAFVLFIDPQVIFQMGAIYVVLIIAFILGAPTLGMMYLTFVIPPRSPGFVMLKIVINIAWIALVLNLGPVLKFSITTYGAL